METKTKQSASRNYCFTAFDINTIESLKKCEAIKYLCYGIEKAPTTDKIHYQGYLELSAPQRISFFKKIQFCETLHLESRKGSRQQAIDYCSKDGDFYEPINKESQQGYRTDIEKCKDIIKQGGSLKDVAEKHFDEFCKFYKAFEKYSSLIETERDEMSKVFIYWGLPGTGKSQYIRNKHKASPNDIYTIVLDNGNGTSWWDGYTKQKIVIFDDFYGNFKYSDLLKICDKYAYKVQFKGGSAQFKPTHIYFTSNVHPRQWYKYDPNFEESAFYRRIHEILHFDIIDKKVKVTKQQLFKPSDAIIEYADPDKLEPLFENEKYIDPDSAI